MAPNSDGALCKQYHILNERNKDGGPKTTIKATYYEGDLPRHQ